MSFTFLGYTFQPRSALGKNGAYFTTFSPAVSKDALKKMTTVVKSWRLHRRVSSTEADLARMINPIVRGWMTYYGAFHRHALSALLHRISTYLLRWIMNKYKRHGPGRRPNGRCAMRSLVSLGTSRIGSG